MNRRRSVRALLVGLLTASCGRSSPPAPPSPVPGQATTRAELPDASAAIRRAAEASGEADLVRFYDLRAFRPAWLDDSRARELLDVLRRAAVDGLDPARYDESAVAALLHDTADPESRAAADVRASRVALAFARDLSVGRVAPRLIDSLWISGNAFDFVAALAAALDSGSIGVLGERLRPPHSGYAALQGALARYRTLSPVDDSTSARIRLIEMNLERWRWLPRDLGRRHLLIDIAAFEAAAMSDAAETLRTRIVAGRADWPTPIVSGRLVAIVVNPRWNVPRDIAIQEILPILRRDTGYLVREAMRVYRGSRLLDPATVDWAAVPDSAFPYRLVQDPGPRNPLGRIKLVFANPFNVALHDTPARHLFAHAERAASHGCVRVERAVDVALWAVGPAGTQAIRGFLDGPEERHIAVTDPISVHVVYFTAAPGRDGQLDVRPDLYGWDEHLARALRP